MEQLGKVKTFLLVDDDPVNNVLNSRLIRKVFGCDVHICQQATEALALLKAGGGMLPDVIFLDINMPVMDGFDLLDELTKSPGVLPESCRVYILTSSIDPQDYEKSQSYGLVRGFISKPLSRQILERLI